MKKGQISRSMFCPHCGAPAVGMEWNGSRWWSLMCHAAAPVRMGSKQRAEVLKTHEARTAYLSEHRRQAIADCTGGQPVDEIELVQGAP